LEKRAENEDGVRLRGEPDKRRIRDHRRAMVCARIFEVWRSAGRSLSYTTDPLTSERQGRLVDFVNAVVACVSEPSGSLDGETIRKDLDGFKRLAPWPSA
jgi:hypothetical protein